MKRKATAISLLIIAFVGLTTAGAVSAQPNKVPNPFAPQPSFWWPKIDQGDKYFQNSWRNPWDDQKLTFKTYKWRFNNDHVKIYLQLYNKRITTNNNVIRGPNNRITWTINKYTIKSLDKNSRFWLRINTVTYDANGKFSGQKNQFVFTRFNAVRYYWIFKNRLITR